MILAGDVGGTKTHLALLDPGRPARAPVHQEKLPSRGHDSLLELVGDFLARHDAHLERAVFGVAGPVVGNRSEATNLAWTMDGGAMSQELGAPVTLINDLEATAWALPLLESKDVEVLGAGQARDGNRAIIAAGTGLGEAIVLRHDHGWWPSPSEGGHSDFAPRDPLEDELLVWLRAQHGRVSYERILSGPGLVNLYRFLAATDRGDEPDGFAERFDAAADPAVVVTEGALDGSCQRAALAVRKFVEIYGAEAGNLALKSLAVGGVYVAGGIAPRLVRFFREGHFITGFTTKGRLSPLLGRIPVSLVLDAEIALWGAAACALASS